MDLALKDRVAVIGGSSAGIGFAIAELFASEGAAVTIVARRKEPLESAAESLRAKTGAPVLAVPADIRRAGDANAALDSSLNVVLFKVGYAQEGLL